MKPNKTTLALTGAALALACVAAWHFWPGASARTASPAGASPGGPAPVSAEVTMQAVKRQALARTIQTFGDVLPQKTIGISSAAAGQITQLAVIQGQTVHKGSLLAILSSDPGNRAAFEQAENAVHLTTAELARVEDLLRLQLATASQADLARKTLADAQAALRQQTRLGAGADIRLTAPADGVVLALNASTGDRLAAGAAIMQLGQTGALKVMLGLDPGQRSRIAKGAEAGIRPLEDGSTDPGDKKPAAVIAGVVTEVQQSIDPRSRLSNVVVLIKPPTTPLVPGMRVQGDIAAGSEDVFVAPRQAVLDDARGAYLFQVRDGRARRVSVQVRIDNGDVLGVQGKLDPALPMVVQGNYELEDGLAVHGAAR